MPLPRLSEVCSFPRELSYLHIMLSENRKLEARQYPRLASVQTGVKNVNQWCNLPLTNFQARVWRV